MLRAIRILAIAWSAWMTGPVSIWGQVVGGPASPNSALAAASVLPARYQNTIMKVSADDGDPDPQRWYFVAYRGNPDGGLFSIVVADGKIIQERASLNLGELFRTPSPIALKRIVVDSPDAFAIALRYAEANGKKLETVSYVLQQRGRAAIPVWEVWCYNPGGRQIGYLEIAATDGTVLSNEGFKRRPSR